MRLARGDELTAPVEPEGLDVRREIPPSELDRCRTGCWIMTTEGWRLMRRPAQPEKRTVP